MYVISAIVIIASYHLMQFLLHEQHYGILGKSASVE